MSDALRVKRTKAVRKHEDDDTATKNTVMTEAKKGTVWNAVLGIDPGAVNCGVALVVAHDTPVRYSVVYADNLRLGGGKRNPPVCGLLEEMREYMMEMFGVEVPHSAVIESQYGYRQACMAHGMQGMMLGQNIPVKMVAPVTLNKRMDRLCKRMEITLDKPPPYKTKRAISKWLHVNFIDKIIPEFDYVSHGRKRDDMADAVIYALYELLGGDEKLA